MFISGRSARRPQTHLLRKLFAASQLLSAANGRSAHPRSISQPFANKFASVCSMLLLLFRTGKNKFRHNVVTEVHSFGCQKIAVALPGKQAVPDQAVRDFSVDFPDRLPESFLKF